MKKDTFSHKGWLQSDYILKRAFAILGHYVLALLTIYGAFLALMIVVYMVVFILGL